VNTKTSSCDLEPTHLAVTDERDKIDADSRQYLPD
jgi:hypothetical protein